MPAPLAVRIAPWSHASGGGDPRSYLQARLALYAKAICAGSAVLAGFVVALYLAYPEQRPPHERAVVVAAVVGQTAFVCLWLALARHRFSIEALHRIDNLFAVLTALELGAAAFLQPERYAVTYSALSFTVFARTIVVPSSGARTFAISCVSFAPMLVGAVATVLAHPGRIDMQALPFLGGVALFGAVAVALATTGSRAIYGLRRQVTQAMQLGQYTLEEKIADGGMGSVYRARHAMLRRPTAIKLLPPDRYGADALRRFEREVQHLSRLTHPNTVAVFDYGRSVDGIFYYAMELLDGVDLETLVRRDGPQPAARVIHILRQICGALDEAHAAGIVHRDIKPGNVILCERGGIPDVAKVVDFGLVREITREGNASSGVTKEITGTPAYISPEAVTDPERVGPCSDLYSLGAVAYFLATGQRVFDGKTDVAVCAQHVTARPRPPSERTDNPIPGELEELILGCLAKDPAQRPASARALRQSLDALGAERPWDERLAAGWWRAFEAQRDASPAPPRTEPLVTITRELAEVEDQPATTGHAR
jgi:serine/threonine-protein kinase